MHDKPRVHSIEARRELRRLQSRHTSNGVILFFGAALLLAAVFAVELGRSYQLMRQVEAFIETLKTAEPAAVKADLDRFSASLSDRNPLVRNSAMAAFKAATEWDIPGGAAEWHNAWQERREKWVPGAAQPDPGIISPQPYRSAFPPK